MPGPSDYVLFGIFGESLYRTNNVQDDYSDRFTMAVGSFLFLCIIFISWLFSKTNQNSQSETIDSEFWARKSPAERLAAVRLQRKEEKRAKKAAIEYRKTYAGAKELIGRLLNCRSGLSDYWQLETEFGLQKDDRWKLNFIHLYGLEMQAEHGDNQTECPPSRFFDNKHQKWNEWESRKGLSKEEAQRKYVNYVKKHLPAAYIYKK
jgi:acyl-CoA-binding protein